MILCKIVHIAQTRSWQTVVPQYVYVEVGICLCFKQLHFCSAMKGLDAVAAIGAPEVSDPDSIEVDI